MNQTENLAVEDKLGLIQRVLSSGDYDVAVKESCTLFEIVFRRIFQQAVVSLSYKDREMILEVERRIGKGIKGVQDFGFGELVGLFRESKLMDKWAKHTGRDLGIIQTLDYSEIVNLRNRITHKGAGCSRGEANLVFEYLRNLLAVLGFADLEGSINQSFKKEYIAQQSGGSEAEAGLLQRLPAIVRSENGKSGYSPVYGNEKERLKIQGSNYRRIDLLAFRQALDGMNGAADLLALDVGSAGGDVTVDRFGEFKEFRHVIGVDLHEGRVAAANGAAANHGGRFSFHPADIEAPDFEDRMKELLRSHGKTHFDFIFSALTLHHLASPLKALFKLRKLLANGGCIVLRGSDDGSKLAYPDEQNLVKTIIWLTQQVEGASDRENGRKLYHQLWKTGFRKIETLYDVIDTAGVGIDQRMALFQGSFSYRIHNFRKRLDRDPGNETFEAEYNWMREALDELEIQFADDSFLYQETLYMAIARK